MIPDGCNIPHQDPPNSAPLANVSTRTSTATRPDPKSGSSSTLSKSYPMTLPSDVPQRPSTAPPHPSSSVAKGKEPQADLRTRTLVSNLRARNLLLQKAISHIDDAVLYLVAARSGIPSSKMLQVRCEARNRKDLLDRVDRAIEMAQNGELHEEGQGVGASGEARSGTDGGRPYTASTPAPIFRIGALSETAPPAHPSNVHSPLSDTSFDALQLRRSSSQPQLGPSTEQPQVPAKVYTLPELMERRKVLQESIVAWRNFTSELLAAQPNLEAKARTAAVLPEVASTQAPAASTTPNPDSSWTVKYQRAQFEIKRREDLLLRLNRAIAQVAPPSPEQFAALASYIPPALDKPRFDAAYAHFCHGKSIVLNTTIVMPDVKRPVIDVYSLHVAVMQEGSFARVSARKSWDVVGGRLGFVRTAATATEPARSSSEIAVHLERAYRDRLEQFDHLYVSSVIETVRKRMAEQQKKP